MVAQGFDVSSSRIRTETTRTSWGHSFAHDGHGNRTVQTITKGSGPSHRVTIDATAYRIKSARYGYHANRGRTQMPLMMMTYDVANRMLSSKHSSAGNQIYGCYHAYQRFPQSGRDSVHNGNTVTYYLYGVGGERLLDFQASSTGGASARSTENQRWIYFAVRKMFSKTGSTLKAITPNRQASEARHHSHGETQGIPSAATKEHFATYRRDDTGLDYAMNRYDSESGSQNSYAQGDSLSCNDPTILSLAPLVPLADGGGRSVDAETDREWRGFAKKARNALSDTCKAPLKTTLGITPEALTSAASSAHCFEFCGIEGKHSASSFTAATGVALGKSRI
jgi:hypothetical protein